MLSSKEFLVNFSAPLTLNPADICQKMNKQNNIYDISKMHANSSLVKLQFNRIHY